MKFPAFSTLSLLALIACSQPQDSSGALSGDVSHHHTHAHAYVNNDQIKTTIKPGPDVSISTKLTQPVAPGNTGTLEVKLKEYYSSGQMTVKASTSEGIELITTVDETIFDMANADEHNWAVHFDTDAPGKHYVNLWVAVETPLGRLTRKSAAVIQVGSDSNATKSELAEIEAGPEGNPVVRMKAQETIIEN